ncbi:TorF family putative porin [Rhodoblastus sp.]|uniref:TorF family putative porin n=1 Tax=Rhodoblastus sp. TaxID=1962975 RepID=UPI0026044309|nr:TorF family putative porin [Rhodoblastus sp.]
MKLTSLIAVAAVLASAGAALAADLPSAKEAPAAPAAPASPWDFDVGATVTSDYLFRGITQSNHMPSVWGRAELRYNLNDNWQLYGGTSAESIKFSPNYFPVGSPAVEWDGDAGVRGTFDKFAFDIGGIVYGYPDSPTGVNYVYSPFLGAYPIGLSPRNPTFFEGYIKPTYTVNDLLTIGANFFASPSYLNTGASDEYLSGTFKLTGPANLSAFSLSGEFGYQWLGKVDSVYTGMNYANYCYIGCQPTAGALASLGQLPSYAYWNVGVSYTWKFVTLDLRYYGTSLSKAEAYVLTGIPSGGSTMVGYSTTSNYADDRFVATLSFDLTSKDLK